MFLLALAALAGCDKNNLSKVPHISDLRQAPDSIRVREPEEDTAYIQFSFEDGNADLGNSIYLRNVLDTGSAPEQLSFSDEFRNVVDPTLGVKGTTTLILPSAFPLFEIADTNILRDTVQLELYLIDRAGNKSNVLTAPPLVLINR